MDNVCYPFQLDFRGKESQVNSQPVTVVSHQSGINSDSKESTRPLTVLTANNSSYNQAQTINHLGIEQYCIARMVLFSRACTVNGLLIEVVVFILLNMCFNVCGLSVAHLFSDGVVLQRAPESAR